MFKKKYILTLVILITATFLITKLKSPTYYYYGEHAELLNKSYISENYTKSKKFIDYCKKNNINDKYVFMYKLSYKVTDKKDLNKLDYSISPIINNNLKNSIIGIKTNIKLIENNNSPFYKVTAQELLKTIKDGKLIEIYYLVDINSANKIANNELISKIQNTNLKTDFRNTTSSKPIVELADNIILSMDENDRDSLSKVTNQFVTWISQNINYPINLNERNKIRSQYINLNDPLKTLKLKIGVCDDNSQLLIELLKSIGVESQYAETIAPFSISQGEVPPSEYTPHSVVIIRGNASNYVVDPTGQPMTNINEYKITNNQLISVSKANKNDLLQFLPTIITRIIPNVGNNSINDFNRNSNVEYDLLTVKTIKLID